jgi:hypothetical protein
MSETVDQSGSLPVCLSICVQRTALKIVFIDTTTVQSCVILLGVSQNR